MPGILSAAPIRIVAVTLRNKAFTFSRVTIAGFGRQSEITMVKTLFRDDAYLAECTAEITRVDSSAMCLSATVFYAAAGGQVGDTGMLILADGTQLKIVDTRKLPDSDDIVHIIDADCIAAAARLAPGTKVTARIDWTRRYRLMRLHTLMHLLCAVVPAPVTGGSITPERAHLDFDVEMEKLKKDEIETAVNALVAAGHEVIARWISDEELAARPELVRTMSVKPPMGTGRVRLLEIPGVDLQPCGGTHIRNTAEIGRVQVNRIRSEGKRNKRVTMGFAETAQQGR